MEAFITTLLKYDPRSLVHKECGVLGHVNGYYVCVEAQGRGSLHCHMLVWIEGSLNPNELKKKVLSDDAFQKIMISYLENMISTCVPSNSGCNLTVPSDKLEATSIRGLNKGIEYEPQDDEHQKDLHNLVKRCQRHVHNATCFKYWKGPPEPKECRF